MPASIPNDIYQYSLYSAYTSGLQDGGPPVAFLTNHGTHGIGIFELETDSDDEDGPAPSASTAKPNEMIQIDGVAHAIDPAGHVTPADQSDTMPFVMVTVFQPTWRVKLRSGTSCDVLKEKIRRNTPLPFCITGSFKYINTQQETYWDVKGKIFGFVIPEWQKGVSGDGCQSRFLSEDKRRGGSVLDFETGDATLEHAKCGRFHLGFPQDEDYDELKL